MNEEVSHDVNVEPKNSTKKNGFKKGYILSAVVLILVIAGIYKVVFCNPKNIFLQSINNEYKNFDKIFDDSTDSFLRFPADTSVISNSEFSLNIKAQEGMFDENQKVLFDEINKLRGIMNVSYDAKGKQFSYEINAMYENTSLLNVIAYGKDQKKIFMELKNLFDKYIEIPVEDYNSLFSGKEESIEDTKFVLETIKDSILKNMDKKDFSTKNETITLGTESVKTKRITYTITEKVACTLSIDVFSDLKKNEKFIKAFSRISEQEVNEVKEMFEDTINTLKDNKNTDMDTTTKIEFSVYTKGALNDAVQYEFKISGDENVVIQYSNYKDVKRINFIQDDTSILSIVKEQSKTDEYVTTISAQTMKFVINSKKDDNTWTHTYKGTVPLLAVEMRGNLIVENKEVEKDKLSTSKIAFTFGVGAKNEEDMITVSATMNGTKKVVESVTIPDTSNSKLITELTEEDNNTIMNNLMANQTLMNFINRITELLALDSDVEDTSFDITM